MKKALKIYISVDMEGMAGITSPSQERDEVPSFRRALHNQVRWIIEGIHASSRNEEIGEITISDSHGSGTNLSYDELCQMDERISLVSGSPRRQYMMSCLDETYDVVFLAGYHAGPGEDFANMDHSFYGRVVSSLKINGAYMNESTTNAALAASSQTAYRQRNDAMGKICNNKRSFIPLRSKIPSAKSSQGKHDFCSKGSS